jgi:hypothetical protein
LNFLSGSRAAARHAPEKIQSEQIPHFASEARKVKVRSKSPMIDLKYLSLIKIFQLWH